MQGQYISLEDLRKVNGIGNKTIERIKEQLLQNELDKNYVSKYDESIKLDMNNIYQGDCLELMNGIPDKSIDMILCDLPYGTTACSWDTIIPFDKLWKQYERIIKDNGAIVLFGSEPFSTKLRSSNLSIYRYDLIWCKDRPSNVMLSKKQPLKYHENISIFYKQQPCYNPQMTISEDDNRKRFGIVYDVKEGVTNKNKGYVSKTHNPKLKYPKSHLFFKRNWRPQDQLHSSQKPVDLLEYLIKTYTSESDVILDNCIGSGSTIVATKNTNRNYIGIELDENYFNIAKNRINEHIDNFPNLGMGL